MTGFERSRLMHRLADLIERDADRLAELESRDSASCCASSPARCGCCRPGTATSPGWADKLAGESIPSDKPNFVAFTQRVPVGVVGGDRARGTRRCCC